MTLRKTVVVQLFLMILCVALPAQGSTILQTIQMPDDYDGKVVCTMIERQQEERVERSQDNSRAVLYVHGYNDYFFQEAMADSILSYGYRFYAVELRKYGRSILPHHKPFFVRDMSEYFADMDSVIGRIRASGVQEVILLGHSTGGLIVSLYASARPGLPYIKGLVLNSPFLDFNMPKIQSRFLIPFLSFLSPIVGNLEVEQEDNIVYGQTLRKDHFGEWEYDGNLKFLHPPKVSIYWLSAIYKGHMKIKKGLNIKYPVWVMRSDKSLNPTSFTPLAMKADCVLNVEHIRSRTPLLSALAREVVVPDGLHDLALSPLPVRTLFYNELRAILVSTK